MKKIFTIAMAAVAVCLVACTFACGNKGGNAQSEEPAEVSYSIKYDFNALSGDNYEAFKLPRDNYETPLDVQIDGDKAIVSFTFKIERGEGEVKRDFKDYSYADLSVYDEEKQESKYIRFNFADDKDYTAEVKGKAAGEQIEIKLVGETTKGMLDSINGKSGHVSLWM